MYFVVCKKDGYELAKHHKKDKALIFDKTGTVVFRGNAYQANQEFLRLTTKGA